MDYKYEINRELRELNNEKAVNEHYLNKEKEKFAFLLKNEMGKDIDSVLSGEVKVKLSFFNNISYSSSLEYLSYKFFADNLTTEIRFLSAS